MTNIIFLGSNNYKLMVSLIAVSLAGACSWDGAEKARAALVSEVSEVSEGPLSYVLQCDKNTRVGMHYLEVDNAFEDQILGSFMANDIRVPKDIAIVFTGEQSEVEYGIDALGQEITTFRYDAKILKNGKTSDADSSNEPSKFTFLLFRVISTKYVEDCPRCSRSPETSFSYSFSLNGLEYSGACKKSYEVAEGTPQ